MKRLVIWGLLPLVFCMLADGAFGQEKPATAEVKIDEGSPDQFKGTFSLSMSSSEGPDETEDSIVVPDEFEENLVTLTDPPMKIGHTGDRVRELQATLNVKLGGKTIRYSYQGRR